MLLAACTSPEQSIEIRFEARLGDQLLQCAADGDVSLSDLRFYAFSPALISAAGELTPIELNVDSRWQGADLALVDLEDGSGACSNGTPGTHSSISGNVPAGDYRGLRFAVAVPFNRNHADPLAAAAPLNDSTMHWHWRSGYKFMRAGITSKDDGYWMHIGSSACEGTVQNITRCERPNRMIVDLPDFEPGDVVQFNFDVFADAADLTDGTISSCSSGPAEASCGALFTPLGLHFDDGSTQGVISAFRLGQP